MNDKEKSLKRCVNKTNLVKLGAIRPCSVEIIPFTLLDKQIASDPHAPSLVFTVCFFAAFLSPLRLFFSSFFSNLFFNLQVLSFENCGMNVMLLLL